MEAVKQQAGFPPETPGSVFPIRLTVSAGEAVEETDRKRHTRMAVGNDQQIHRLRLEIHWVGKKALTAARTVGARLRFLARPGPKLYNAHRVHQTSRG